MTTRILGLTLKEAVALAFKKGACEDSIEILEELEAKGEGWKPVLSSPFLFSWSMWMLAVLEEDLPPSARAVIKLAADLRGKIDKNMENAVSDILSRMCAARKQARDDLYVASQRAMHALAKAMRLQAIDKGACDASLAGDREAARRVEGPGGLHQAVLLAWGALSDAEILATWAGTGPLEDALSKLLAGYDEDMDRAYIRSLWVAKRSRRLALARTEAIKPVHLEAVRREHEDNVSQANSLLADALLECEGEIDKALLPS